MVLVLRAPLPLCKYRRINLYATCCKVLSQVDRAITLPRVVLSWRSMAFDKRFLALKYRVGAYIFNCSTSLIVLNVLIVLGWSLPLL